jgi:hypothetical protein
LSIWLLLWHRSFWWSCHPMTSFFGYYIHEIVKLWLCTGEAATNRCKATTWSATFGEWWIWWCECREITVREKAAAGKL